MKLYQILKNSIIYEDCNDRSSWFKFKRMDGIYSICVTEKGNVIHLGANTELNQTNINEYIIVERK